MDKVVEFVRDYQTRYTKEKVPFSYKINPDDFYWISFYNRKDELSKDSREYHEQITDLYKKEVHRLND